jgi:hypothetical protein
MTDRGKIKARTNTGTCAQHQRDVAVAIKTAREMIMLPYVVRTLAADKSSGRQGRGGGRPGGRPTEAAAAEGNGAAAEDGQGDGAAAAAAPAQLEDARS